MRLSQRYLKDKYDTYLRLILICAFLLRISLNFPIFQDQAKSKHNDSASYYVLAENLSQGNGYSNCLEAPYHKDIEITPVYPIFLSLAFKVFGQDLRIIILVQILLDVLVVWMLFRLSLTLFSNKKAALITSILYGISSHAITYSGSILTEGLFTYILVLCFYTIVCIEMRVYFKATLIAGLWCILVLCRPIALYTLPLFLFLWMALEWRTYPSINFFYSSLLILAIGIIGIFPWMNRNEKLSGVYTISSISDYNLYGVNANSIISKQKNVNEDEHREYWLSRLDSPLFGQCLGNYSYVKEVREKGSAVIKENLWFYIKIHLTYIPNMFLPEITKISENWNLSTGNKGTLAVLNSKGFRAAISHYFEGSLKPLLFAFPLILFWIITLFTGIFGLIRLVFKKRWELFFPISLILGYYIFLPGPVSTPRFMYPMVPLICILGGYALSEWLTVFRQRV